MADLVRTIDDDDDDALNNHSEESSEDEELQPTRKRAKTTGKAGGIEAGFKFSNFSQDVWLEKLNSQPLSRQKKIIKTSLDSKIQKHCDNNVDTNVVKVEDSSDGSEASDCDPEHENGSNHGDDMDDDDIDLSDDELVDDKVVVKTKKGKTKKLDLEEDIDEDLKLDDDPDYVVDTDTSFQQMSLSRPLLKSIAALGFVHPTRIQAAAIPIALAGRDICGCAATGTGKTAAYMLPILERLLYKPKHESVTRVLCLVPTRELGVQVYQVSKNLSSFSNDIQVALAVGGLDLQEQESVLRTNPDIVIATPGRLIDHLGNTPSFSLSCIEILVLDEADRMLDEWFAEQLKEIVRQCSPRRQTLLFSATMTDRVKDLATVSLKNPCKIFVDSNKQVAFNLRQQFVKIRVEQDREAIACALIVRTFHSKTMVFVPTKVCAHRLHIKLGLFGIRIGELHGDLSQTKRLEALKKFQSSQTDVLIVTDVAARGLDIPGVQSVVNYTMPPTLEQYIHRCGRTARAGRSGVAISLVGEHDRKLMKQVTKAATNPVKARIIPPEIIAKYREKLTALAAKVDAILKEEEAEKALEKAEIEANRALKRIKERSLKKKNAKKLQIEDGNKRKWFQSHKERKLEQEKLQGKTPAQLRKAIANAQEQMKIKNIVDYQKRQVKNRSKGKIPGNQGVDSSSKKKKNSYFDDEITNISKARVFRHKPKSFNSSKQKPSSNTKSKSKPKQFQSKSNKKFGQKLKHKKRK